VFIIAKISNPLASFTAKICVSSNISKMKPTSSSNENIPAAVIIIKNQKENPADTVSDLNLGDERSILDWIDE